MAFTTKATIASFGGKLLKLSHASAATGTDMAVSVYLPPQAASGGRKVPVLVYLSGLTCSPDNCAEKGFFQHGAARHGLAVVYPDTSPRGLDLPGIRDSWDFGEAASFYVDAARAPFADNFRMETYLTEDLPAALAAGFPDELDLSRVAITGHSMGGHGALSLYLRHPGRYRSVSAFAPIANPSRCPWGEKAFAGYLGDDREAWKAHDSTELVRGWEGDLRMLIDVVSCPLALCLLGGWRDEADGGTAQGTGDNFYKQGQLLPENFEKAVKDAGLSGLTLRYQEVGSPRPTSLFDTERQGRRADRFQGYDHSYFFMATFSDDHVAHAAKHLAE